MLFMQLEGILTLIIPAYSRPQFLKRLMLYLHERDVLYTIVIADSSPARECDKDRSVVESLHKSL